MLSKLASLIYFFLLGQELSFRHGRRQDMQSFFFEKTISYLRGIQRGSHKQVGLEL